MAAIQWTDEFSVRVKEIDEQHKKLINLFNKLNDANERGEGSNILSYVFFELVNYSVRKDRPYSGCPGISGRMAW